MRLCHHYDGVGHGQGLLLVVGDVDDGAAGVVVQALQLGPHIHAELGVQVGQRLVQQEDCRVTNHCTAQSNTLTLTTGQSLGLAVQQVLDLQDLGSLVNAAVDLSFGVLRSSRPKAMFL